MIRNPIQTEISVVETSILWKEGKIKLLDVRGEAERRIASIKNVPMMDGKLASEIVAAWPKDTPIVVYCHHGKRSLDSVAWLRGFGFKNAFSMAGGIDAWSCEVDPSVPRY